MTLEELNQLEAARERYLEARAEEYPEFDDIATEYYGMLEDLAPDLIKLAKLQLK